jgi:hypothetical protein
MLFKFFMLFHSLVTKVSHSARHDPSVLVGGIRPAVGTYDVVYSGAYSSVTGIRLEVLEDASLPFNGPGTQSINGNFVLTEITLNPSTVVPAPPALPMLAAGIAALAYQRRRRPSAG